MEKKKDLNKIDRRRFLLWLIPLISSFGIIRLFTSLYPGSIDWSLFKGRKIGNRPKNTSTNQRTKIRRNRENWHNPNLVLNSKTNVVHYPTERLFTYYNKIADKHISIVQFPSWEKEVVSPKHFIKGSSGIILENLALKDLSIPFSNDKLQKAIQTLSIAFSEQYKSNPKSKDAGKYQMNTCNWRLYHLLIQLIALNTSIPIGLKWSKFSDIIKHVDFKSVKIPPKNNWVKSKIEFDKRIKYIEANMGLYTKRIEERI